jgi:hypothetical protein
MREADPLPARKLLLGCGILKKEIAYLVEKNGWPVDTRFLDSALHVSFGRLSAALEGAIEKSAGRDVVVFYGACHPLIDTILSAAGTHRTEGQNCVEILLGREAFTRELSAGAFFLMEDWVLRWDSIIRQSLGDNPDVRREIFRSAHSHFLALRTPCSGDFLAGAEAIGASLGLPVRVLDVSLDPLERELARSLFGTGRSDG